MHENEETSNVLPRKNTRPVISKRTPKKRLFTFDIPAAILGALQNVPSPMLVEVSSMGNNDDHVGVENPNSVVHIEKTAIETSLPNQSSSFRSYRALKEVNSITMQAATKTSLQENTPTLQEKKRPAVRNLLFSYSSPTESSVTQRQLRNAHSQEQGIPGPTTTISLDDTKFSSPSTTSALKTVVSKMKPHIEDKNKDKFNELDTEKSAATSSDSKTTKVVASKNKLSTKENVKDVSVELPTEKTRAETSDQDASKTTKIVVPKGKSSSKGRAKDESVDLPQNEATMESSSPAVAKKPKAVTPKRKSSSKGRAKDESGDLPNKDAVAETKSTVEEVASKTAKTVSSSIESFTKEKQSTMDLTIEEAIAETTVKVASGSVPNCANVSKTVLQKRNSLKWKASGLGKNSNVEGEAQPNEIIAIENSGPDAMKKPKAGASKRMSIVMGKGKSAAKALVVEEPVMENESILETVSTSSTSGTVKLSQIVASNRKSSSRGRAKDEMSEKVAVTERKSTVTEVVSGSVEVSEIGSPKRKPMKRKASVGGKNSNIEGGAESGESIAQENSGTDAMKKPKAGASKRMSIVMGKGKSTTKAFVAQKPVVENESILEAVSASSTSATVNLPKIVASKRRSSARGRAKDKLSEKDGVTERESAVTEVVSGSAEVSETGSPKRKPLKRKASVGGKNSNIEGGAEPGESIAQENSGLDAMKKPKAVASKRMSIVMGKGKSATKKLVFEEPVVENESISEAVSSSSSGTVKLPKIVASKRRSSAIGRAKDEMSKKDEVIERENTVTEIVSGSAKVSKTGSPKRKPLKWKASCGSKKPNVESATEQGESVAEENADPSSIKIPKIVSSNKKLLKLKAVGRGAILPDIEEVEEQSEITEEAAAEKFVPSASTKASKESLKGGKAKKISAELPKETEEAILTDESNSDAVEIIVADLDDLMYSGSGTDKSNEAVTTQKKSDMAKVIEEPVRLSIMRETTPGDNVQKEANTVGLQRTFAIVTPVRKRNSKTVAKKPFKKIYPLQPSMVKELQRLEVNRNIFKYIPQDIKDLDWDNLFNIQRPKRPRLAPAPVPSITKEPFFLWKQVKRTAVDITDLEVALTNVAQQFKEIRNNNLSQDLCAILDNFEQTLTSDITQELIKVVQIQNGKKDFSKLLKQVKARNDVLGELVAEQLKLQLEFAMKK